MAARIKIRRDEAADWTSVNPVLHQGELGIEIDTNRMKIGDGITAWNSLPYFAPAGSGDMLAANNLSDVDNAGTARTNLGLGTAALEDTSAFDAAGAAAAAQAASQPADSDLTAIATLATTSYGRDLLTLANNAALLGVIGPSGSASGSTYLRGDGVWATPAGSGGDLISSNNLSDVDNVATALSNLGGQPVDSDLTAIAALTTTPFGRSLLTAANAAAFQTAVGLEIGTDVASAAQGALADTALQSVDISDINTTGTADGTTYLRGDGVWSVLLSESATPDGGYTYIQSTSIDGVPTSPSVGDTWFEIDDSATYLYYDNGGSPIWIQSGDVGGTGGSGDMVFAVDVIDEDNMASDLDTKVPTQQSVKAFVEAATPSTIYGGDAASTF